MTNPDLIATAQDATALQVEQWVIAMDGQQYCLVDTHVGAPQRMWMKPGGMTHFAVDAIPYPLRLADLDEPEGRCPHSWGTQEGGHCRRCGRRTGEARPTFFTAEARRTIAAIHAAERVVDVEQYRHFVVDGHYWRTNRTAPHGAQVEALTEASDLWQTTEAYATESEFVSALDGHGWSEITAGEVR